MSSHFSNVLSEPVQLTEESLRQMWDDFHNRPFMAPMRIVSARQFCIENLFPYIFSDADRWDEWKRNGLLGSWLEAW